MFNEVIFDLETKKLFSEIEGNDPGDLGVSVVSLYKRKLDGNLQEVKGNLMSFWENEFDRMWPIFQEADRIIGFNSLNFDVSALAPYANFPFHKLPHFDIIVKVKDAFGHRISLNDIARETLDREKSDYGLNAVLYWQKGDKESLSRLQKYCEEDVIITREIYDFGLKNKFLRFKDKWNTLREIEVDFSYIKKDFPEKQIGLF